MLIPLMYCKRVVLIGDTLQIGKIDMSIASGIKLQVSLLQQASTIAETLRNVYRFGQPLFNIIKEELKLDIIDKADHPTSYTKIILPFKCKPSDISDIVEKHNIDVAITIYTNTNNWLKHTC